MFSIVEELILKLLAVLSCVVAAMTKLAAEMEVSVELVKVLVIMVLVPGGFRVVVVGVVLLCVKLVYVLVGVVEESVEVLEAVLVGVVEVSVKVLVGDSGEIEVVLVGVVTVSAELV